MRYLIIASWLLLSMASAAAQVSVGISMPGLSIGINVPTYPQLVRVPGYPVYYAQGMRANFFFYDGMYWVFQDDNWYASSWYNGPWELVGPESVPLFVLRIPVRYYGSPPGYFTGWRREAPPRWGEHWGRDWEQRRGGWDQWDRRAVPAPAPLPMYQRQYSGNRYPAPAQQPVLRAQNYRYEPREAVVKQHFQQAVRAEPVPAPRAQSQAPEQRPQQQAVRPAPHSEPAPAPRAQPQAPAQHPEARAVQPAPVQRQERPVAQEPARSSHQAAAQPEKQTPSAAPNEAARGKAAPHEQPRGKDREKDRGKGDERGQDDKKERGG